jgi:hypothetical protein
MILLKIVFSPFIYVSGDTYFATMVIALVIYGGVKLQLKPFMRDLIEMD